MPPKIAPDETSTQAKRSVHLVVSGTNTNTKKKQKFEEKNGSNDTFFF